MKKNNIISFASKRKDALSYLLSVMILIKYNMLSIFMILIKYYHMFTVFMILITLNTTICILYSRFF